MSESAPPVLDTWHQALEDVWEKQHNWSTQADALKRSESRLTGPLTAMTLLGALLGTASPQLAHWVEAQHLEWLRIALGVLPALLVSISAYLTHELLGPKHEEQWIVARMISEGLKAEGYIYAVRAPPYSKADEAPLQLNKRTADIEQKGASLPLPKAKVDGGDSKRPRDAIDTAAYVAQRVKPQVKYHLEGALKNQQKLMRWRSVGILLGLISLVIGALGTALHQESFNVWLGMVTTAVATLNSFVYGQRFEFLASSYASTARTLDALAKRWQLIASQQDSERARFVLDCEAAIASQNRLWADRFSKPVSGDSGNGVEAAPPAMTSPPGDAKSSVLRSLVRNPA